jgi:flagellin
MSRINTNVSSLIAQKILGRTNADLQTALNRLSTGLRINSGKDDPAGLIASENLRRDITAANKAISNTERANQMIATADSALGQISSLLNDIRGLVTEAANSGVLSDEQIAANQLQVDSSLEAIDRISQVTTFQGRRLLDGSLDFTINVTAGAGTYSDLQVQQANLGSAGSLAVTVTISAAATQAINTRTVGADPITNTIVFRVGGLKGSEVFTFNTGATGAQIASAVNLVSDSTGVGAAFAAGVLTLTSTAYGSDAFVDVEEISDAGALFQGSQRTTGTDIAGSINGFTAAGNGNTLSLNTASLDMSLTVNDGSNTTVTFNITGGGAVFQLGPQVQTNQQSRIGIQSVNTGILGGSAGRMYQIKSGQSDDLDSDPTTAAQIVDQAITKVTTLRGRFGALQRTTLETNMASLQDTVSNLAEAESAIRDADFAQETARLTRAQILVQSGTQVLAIANQNPQNVLALLQR